MSNGFAGPLTEQQTALLTEFRMLYKLHGQDVALEKEPRLQPVYDALDKAEAMIKLNGARFEKAAKASFLDYVRDWQMQIIVLELPEETWVDPVEDDLDDITAALESPRSQSAFPFSKGGKHERCNPVN